MRRAVALSFARSIALSITALGAAVWTSVAASDIASAGARADAPATAFDVTLNDLDGAPHRLASLAGPAATVVAFTSGTCPLSRKFAPELDRIETEFANRGVAFVRVAARGEEREPLRALLDGRQCLIDAHDALARVIRPASTTEVFVFDGARALQYRGAINDQYGLSYTRPYPRSHYLRSVLEAVLRGDAPLLHSTVAPGCALAILPVSIGTPTTTYHEHIAPLIAKHCLECHREGGPSPFRLETYDQVAGKAAMIRQVVADRLMPPWSAAPAHADRPVFANDRALRDDDRAAIIRWVDEGAAAGDAAKATLYDRPEPIEGWQIGTPDLVLQIPTANVIPAEGALPYVMVSVPTGLTEERFVQAIEVQPTSMLGVHHVLVFALPGPEERNAGRRRNLELAQAPRAPREVKRADDRAHRHHLRERAADQTHRIRRNRRPHADHSAACTRRRGDIDGALRRAGAARRVSSSHASARHALPLRSGEAGRHDDAPARRSELRLQLAAPIPAARSSRVARRHAAARDGMVRQQRGESGESRSERRGAVGSADV